MIRNHAGDPVKSTVKLIETLKKVGIIKTKKPRAKRGLATDEIRQNNDMGPGYSMATPRPLVQFTQGGQAPLLLQNAPQGGFNQAQIEDIQRTYNQQIGLLQDQVQRQSEEQRRIQNMGFALGGAVSYLQQRLDRPIVGVEEPVDPFANVEGNNDDVEASSGEIIDSDDQEQERVGPQPGKEEVQTTTPGAGFVEEEEATFSVQEPQAPPPRARGRGETPIGEFLSKRTISALDEVNVARPTFKTVPDLQYAMEEYARKTGQTIPNIERNRKIRASGKKEDTVDTIKRLINDLIANAK